MLHKTISTNKIKENHFYFCKLPHKNVPKADLKNNISLGKPPLPTLHNDRLEFFEEFYAKKSAKKTPLIRNFFKMVQSPF